MLTGYACCDFQSFMRIRILHDVILKLTVCSTRTCTSTTRRFTLTIIVPVYLLSTYSQGAESRVDSISNRVSHVMSTAEAHPDAAVCPHPCAGHREGDRGPRQRPLPDSQRRPGISRRHRSIQSKQWDIDDWSRKKLIIGRKKSREIICSPRSRQYSVYQRLWGFCLCFHSKNSLFEIDATES